MARASAPHPLHCIYNLGLGVVAQGDKQVLLGEESIHDGHSFSISTLTRHFRQETARIGQTSSDAIRATLETLQCGSCSRASDAQAWT